MNSANYTLWGIGDLKQNMSQTLFELEHGGETKHAMFSYIDNIVLELKEMTSILQICKIKVEKVYPVAPQIWSLEP